MIDQRKCPASGLPRITPSIPFESPPPIQVALECSARPRSAPAQARRRRRARTSNPKPASPIVQVAGSGIVWILQLFRSSETVRECDAGLPGTAWTRLNKWNPTSPRASAGAKAPGSFCTASVKPNPLVEREIAPNRPPAPIFRRSGSIPKLPAASRPNHHA